MHKTSQIGGPPAGRSLSSQLHIQANLVTREQALAAGMTEATLRARIRPGGRWLAVLPGIYLAHRGELTPAQREIAAILHAGQAGVVTGTAAIRVRGLPVPYDGFVDVLVPHSCRRQSTEFVRIHRTRRMPTDPLFLYDILYAQPARAVADAIRGKSDRGEVVTLVGMAVQQSACTIEQLAVELRAGPRRGSGSLRAALAEVASGVVTVAEADFARLIKRSRLPEPVYNASLYVGSQFLAKADAWWPDAGVAAEVDSREWHLSPLDWEKTMARHGRMSAQGILVLHFPPRRIRSDAARVVAELRAALEAGRDRPSLPVRLTPIEDSELATDQAVAAFVAESSAWAHARKRA